MRTLGEKLGFSTLASQIAFCKDSTHELAGKTVALPELPVYLRD